MNCDFRVAIHVVGILNSLITQVDVLRSKNIFLVHRIVNNKTKSQWSCCCLMVVNDSLMSPELRCHLKKRTLSSTQNQTEKNRKCEQKHEYTQLGQISS